MKLTDLLQTDKYKEIVRTATDTYDKEYTLVGNYAVTMTQVLKCTVEESDGKLCVTDKKPVCSKPILPTAIYDNQDEAVQKVEVSYWNKGGTVQHKTVVNRSVLTNKNKVLQLADNGFPIGSDNAQYVANYLNSVLCEYDEMLPRRASKSVMGWTKTDDDETVFMPYTDALAFDGEETYRHLYNAISERGSKADWISFMRELRSDPLGAEADCNIPLRLVMAASFASPMVELIGENPFVVHLFAPTGQGKTVTLMVAMSVWGDPGNGKLTRSLNMTTNSMLSTAAFLNNLPFAGDELQTLKSRWNKSYDQIVMQLTEGVDRGRMNGANLLRARTWRNAFIFTGEDPIIKASSGGGTANRVIQVEADGKLIRNGNRTANFVKAHYGSVGREWIELLRSERDNLSDMYNAVFSEIISNCETTDKQAGAMAMLLLADNMASDQFFSGERKLWIDDVRPYLASQNQVDIADRAWNFVVDYLAEHGENFTDAGRIRWGETEGDAVYINKTVLIRALADNGYDFDAVKKRWISDNRLELNDKHKTAFYRSIGGIKAYYVKLIMDELTDDKMKDLPF